MGRRVVRMNVVRGEPTDGNGRVAIHLFLKDEGGPFVEPHVLHQVMRDGSPVKGELEARPARGRLACDSRRLVEPVKRDGVTIITPRSDDPRAVTCTKCRESSEYKALMKVLNSI